MSRPIPPITGGAATSGDIRSSLGLNFAPVNVGGLFGSSGTGNSGQQMLLHISAGIAVGFVLSRFLKRR